MASPLFSALLSWDAAALRRLEDAAAEDVSAALAVVEGRHWQWAAQFSVTAAEPPLLPEVLRKDTAEEAAALLEQSLEQVGSSVRLVLWSAALLQSFVQANWTGPPLSCGAAEGGVAEPSEEQRQSFRSALSVDGEALASVRVRWPELLLLARRALQHDKLRSVPESALWEARAALIHQRVLQGPSPELRSTAVQRFDAAAALFCSPRLDLERAQLHFYYHEVSAGKERLLDAQKQTGLTVQLTGRMGRRTKYQRFDVPQLVLDIKSAVAPPADPSQPLSDEQAVAVPKEVALDADTILLDAIKFKEAEPSDGALRCIDQCIILGLCVHVSKSAAKDDLTNYEMLPYVMSVLKQPQNWMVQTAALYIKSRLESERVKTVDRAAMQLQALVDQWGAEQQQQQQQQDGGGDSSSNHSNRSVSERLRWIYCLPYPPLHELKKELGKRYLSMGVAMTALQLFEELEMWHDVVLCYQIMRKVELAERVVLRMLKEKPDDPELLTLLADLRDDPALYEKAWEVSGRKYSKAKRWLGLLYARREQWAECTKHLRVALELNPLHPRAWYTLGCAAMRTEEWALAARSFSQMVAQEPDEGEAWANLGTSCRKMGKNKEAFAAYSEAVKHKYDSWKIWENFLIIAYDLRQPQHIIRAQHRLLEIRGRYDIDPAPLRYLVSIVCEALERQDVHDSWKRLDKAVGELLGRIASIVPNDANIWQTYSVLRRARGDVDLSLVDKMKECRAVARGAWLAEQREVLRMLRALRELAELNMQHGTYRSAYSAHVYMKSSLKKMEKDYADLEEWKKTKQSMEALGERVAALKEQK